MRGLSIASFPAASLLVASLVVASLLAATPSPSPAQETAPPDDRTVTQGQREQFMLCRAVALLHLRTADWETAVVDEDMTRMLLEQITFVMAETVYAQPPQNLADGGRRLVFVENYFFNLREVFAGVMDRFPTIESRDAFLLDCAPFIWVVMTGHIDKLMEWRNRASEDLGPAWRHEALEGPRGDDER